MKSASALCTIFTVILLAFGTRNVSGIEFDELLDMITPESNEGGFGDILNRVKSLFSEDPKSLFSNMFETEALDSLLSSSDNLKSDAYTTHRRMGQLTRYLEDIQRVMNDESLDATKIAEMLRGGNFDILVQMAQRNTREFTGFRKQLSDFQKTLGEVKKVIENPEMIEAAFRKLASDVADNVSSNPAASDFLTQITSLMSKQGDTETPGNPLDRIQDVISLFKKAMEESS